MRVEVICVLRENSTSRRPGRFSLNTSDYISIAHYDGEDWRKEASVWWSHMDVARVSGMLNNSIRAFERCFSENAEGVAVSNSKVHCKIGGLALGKGLLFKPEAVVGNGGDLVPGVYCAIDSDKTTCSLTMDEYECLVDVVSGVHLHTASRALLGAYLSVLGRTGESVKPISRMTGGKNRKKDEANGKEDENGDGRIGEVLQGHSGG